MLPTGMAMRLGSPGGSFQDTARARRGAKADVKGIVDNAEAATVLGFPQAVTDERVYDAAHA
eukprot:362349-Chlamydomonas_euryale.AAC.2